MVRFQRSGRTPVLWRSAILLLLVFATPATVLAQDVRRPAGDAESPSRPKPYVGVVQEALAWEVPAAGDASTDDEAARDAILESEAMVEALAWLDQYFAVQVDYAPAEVAEFRERIGRMSAAQLRTLLSKLAQERVRRLQQHQSGEQLRDQMLTRHAARRFDPPQWQPPAGFGRNPYRRPPAPVRRYDRYGVQPPLITSRDVATLTLFRVIVD